MSTSSDSETSYDHVQKAPSELSMLEDDENSDSLSQMNHDTVTAPLLSADVYLSERFKEIGRSMQYGVLGRLRSSVDKETADKPLDPRLYVNVNAPFSALVCGVQGSGKSHTVSVMLESMLLSNCTAIGNLKKPLAGLVLHYGEGGGSARPCEAAYLSQISADFMDLELPEVTVYVSPFCESSMKAVYAPLGPKVVVKPLRFSENELDAQALCSLMAVNVSANMPLYMHVVLNILRELGDRFSYKSFIRRLDEAKKNFAETQSGPLNQRLSILTSFVDKKKDLEWDRFSSGKLTIVDLSDPFVDPSLASNLFEIVTRLFIREDLGTGKVLVVDEAHKYLSRGETSGLTTILLRLIREQRHLGMRVIISTQEPTVVPPVFIDLCSVTILHRFSSLDWWKSISNHLSADLSQTDAFNSVLTLRTGESIVIAPSGLMQLQCRKDSENLDDGKKEKIIQFGRRYLLVKSRKRVTADGGASVLVLQSD